MEVQETEKRPLTKKQIAGLVVLFMMILCVVMIIFLLVFQVRKIKVEGNQFSSDQEIQEWLLEDEMSTNSAYLMWKFHFSDYGLLPTMKSADMKMINPWTLQVDITEKTLVGYIEQGEECVYFDEEGRVLAKTTEWWDGVPKVEGLEIEEVTLYEELPLDKKDKKALKKLIEISEMLTKYELTASRLELIEGDVNLYFGNKCVIIGNDNIENRIAQIPPIMEKLGDQKGTLHLENYDAKNTIISFEKEVLPSEVTE